MKGNENMHQNIKKTISALLSVIIILGMFSISIIALEADNELIDISKSDTAVSQTIEDITKCSSDEIVEVENLREANVKHYRLPDGSYKAVVYSHSIHRKDEHGKWIDIDNNITPKTVDGVKQYATPDNRLIFKENNDGCPVLVLADTEYSVTMEFVENNTTSTVRQRKHSVPIIKNSTQSDIDTAKVRSIEETACNNNQSSIKYENVKTDTDIEYVLIGNDIKENIILNSVSDTYTYVFNLSLNGLTPILNDDGSISLINNKENTMQYLIPAPYMYDSAGATSSNVTYTLIKTDSQSYTLTVSADDEWINSEDRVFPVTIDPTIQYDGVVFDTYISSNYKDTNYGSSEKVWISSTQTAFILIETPDIPAGSTIINATLNLPFYYYSSVTDGYVKVCAYEILYPWYEDEITWNIANENPNLGISKSRLSSTKMNAEDSNGIDDPGIATLNISTLMQKWINGRENNGIAIKYYDPDSTNLSVIVKSWEVNDSPESYYVVEYYPPIDATLTTYQMGVGGVQQANYSTYPTAMSATWKSSHTDVATIDSDGIITAHKQGSTLITASCYDINTNSTYTDSEVLYVYDSTGIKNDTKYYIMNTGSKRLLSLESASDSLLTNVSTSPRSSSNLSHWTVKQLSDGRYKFISDYSSTGKCLDVTKGNVDIYNDNGAEYTKFSIERVATGGNKGLYIIKYGYNYVAQDANYNVYITDTRSSSIYWSFMAVNKRYAELFCHDYNYINDSGNERHFDTSKNYEYFKDVFRGLDYSSISYKNPNSSDAYRYLRRDDDIFVYMGHGGSGRIAFAKEGNSITGRILADSNMNFSSISPYYISDLDDNELALSRCVIYLGCSTGTFYTNGTKRYNLIDSTYDKGAHFVLGTTETLYTIQINNWMEYFLDEIKAGNNIQDAIINANLTLGDIEVPYTKDDGSDAYKLVYGLPTYCVGDSTQYLNIQ